MDEIKLQFFASVARHLSFSKAAKECHVAPSTVSRQISALEEELGARLFIRDTQNVRITPAGARLASSLHNYTSQYQAITENIRNLIHHEESRLQITVGPYEFPLVTRLISLFWEARPEMELHPLLNRYERIGNHLQAKTINLAVTAKSCVEALPNCRYFSLGTHQWKAVARRDSSFWKLPPQKQALLCGQRVVISSMTDMDPVRAYCRSHGMEQQGYSYGSFNLACAQVHAGRCIAVMPEYLEPWLHQDLRMQDVFREPLEVESVLIFNPDSPNSLDREFFEYIREHYKP